MTNEQQEYINEINKYLVKYAPDFNIQCYSVPIAQAIKESNWGTSNKVFLYNCHNDEILEEYHNYLGLKWRDGRCAVSNEYFEEWTAEQNEDGSYTNIVSKFCKFNSLEDCVLGYLQWIDISNYASLKGVTSPEEYAAKLKECGYATSITYSTSLIEDYVDKYDLRQYDPVVEDVEESEEEEMSNSNLVNYTSISPNKTSPRNAIIDTITIHCVVGQWTAQKIADYFANDAVKASCNYGVGTDGSISLVVEEKDRSWCSSNSDNDNRAITIEVASDTTDPYAVTEEAYTALIKLLADVCSRNNISELKWKGDSSLIDQTAEQNMTVHRWFSAKACPGDYLYNKHGEIAIPNVVVQKMAASSFSQ